MRRPSLDTRSTIVHPAVLADTANSPDINNQPVARVYAGLDTIQMITSAFRQTLSLLSNRHPCLPEFRESQAAALGLPAGKTNHPKYRLALPGMLAMRVYLSVTITLLGKSNHDQLH